jgi:hypothetical protein
MDKYIIFGLLIVMALLLIIHLYRKDNINEKFANPELPNLQSCPASLNKYTSDVSINCCDGEVVQGKCQGEPVCTLSEKTDKLPRCIDWYKQYLDRMSKRHCPSYLKNFYEDDKLQKVGFCTNSPLNDKLRAPLNNDADKCNIHKTNTDNLKDPNSCLVKKMLDKMMVPTPMSTKSAILVLPNAPVVLQANYFDEMQSKTCMDRPTADAALDMVMPGWRNNTEFQQQFYKKLQFCDVAKRRLDARKEDPNYRSPLGDINVIESRRFNIKPPKFRWRFNWKWPKFGRARFNWKPKQYGICRK